MEIRSGQGLATAADKSFSISEGSGYSLFIRIIKDPSGDLRAERLWKKRTQKGKY